MEQKKENYEFPVLEVLFLDEADILTMSNGGIEGSSSIDHVTWQEGGW